jgi:glucan phosphoethanolaminetransferase (alkaline phosphatase superfamily)
MEKLCAPAIIYLIFSITQILIDSFKGLYNTALMKTVVMIMVTFLLQILCKGGLTIISWIIVFIPFILMTVIVSLLLYFFGLNATTGRLNYTCKNLVDSTNANQNNIHTDSQGNIIVYDPYYNPRQNPVYYQSPNVIIPKPPSPPPTQSPQTQSNPAYQ